MKIGDVAWAARQGEAELLATAAGMQELIDHLTEDDRYGIPVPPPFWLLGVWIDYEKVPVPIARNTAAELEVSVSK
jgi:hypothetical protein